MICPQCDNGRSGCGGMTSVGHVVTPDRIVPKVVWWCETCGTIVSPQFSAKMVPTLVRRVAWMLDEHVQRAEKERRDIHDIMGKIS